ncbi:MAG: hypothetical protein HY508_13875 [Acidobacteria bacterium]|nr:hypothetical protein [Acidobacteriota bacterium]
MMDVEELAEKSAEGSQKLLLAPFYLVTEIFGALIPGILFALLLVGKGNALAINGLGSDLIGYKTKIVAGLIVCYIVGTILRIPIELSGGWVFGGPALISKDAFKQEGGKDMLAYFLGGMVAFPALLGKRRGIDYLAAVYTMSTYYCTCGMALILAGLIPGDGPLRYVEFILGLLMLFVGFLKLRSIFQLAIALIGLSAADWLGKIPTGSIPSILSILASIGQVQEKVDSKLATSAVVGKDDQARSPSDKPPPNPAIPSV